MSTSAPEQPETIYQLKITVHGLSSLIWRRVLVRSDTTIAQLHAIMQMAMGWKDRRLHRFRIQGRAYGVARLGGLLFADDPVQVPFPASDYGPMSVSSTSMTWMLCGSMTSGSTACGRPRPRTGIPSASPGRVPVRPKAVAARRATDVWWPSAAPGRRCSRCRTIWSWSPICLLTVLDGGLCPADDDTAFVAALDRMNDRLEATSTTFNSRAVNAALRSTIEGGVHGCPHPCDRRR